MIGTYRFIVMRFHLFHLVFGCALISGWNCSADNKEEISLKEMPVLERLSTGLYQVVVSDSEESVAPHSSAVIYFSREYAPGELLFSVVYAEEVKVVCVYPRPGSMEVAIVEDMNYEEFLKLVKISSKVNDREIARGSFVYPYRSIHIYTHEGRDGSEKILFNPEKSSALDELVELVDSIKNEN